MMEIDRRRGRRQRGSGKARTIIVVVVGLAVIWFGWSSINRAKPPGSSTVAIEDPQSKQAKANRPVVTTRTFIIIGVEEGQGSKTVKGVIELVYDPPRNRVNGLVIDPNTYVSIPGRGYQSLRDGFTEGPRSLGSAVAQLVGIESEGYLTVPAAVYADIVENKNVGEAFLKYDESNLSRRTAKSVNKKVVGIPKERVTLAELPVKTIVIAEQTYYEPNKQELDRLTRSIWGRPPKTVKKPIRLIILNGNGAPGVARLAADRLIGKGLKILDVKNADRFDYPKTEIIIYSSRARKSGPKIVDALGSGVVIKKEMAQDVTDIVVVIGKDFH